jgi:hypothetical protein
MRFDYNKARSQMVKERYRGLHYILISPTWEIVYKTIPGDVEIDPRLIEAGNTPHLPTEEVAKANILLLVFQDNLQEMVLTKIIKNKYNISVMREINAVW